MFSPARSSCNCIAPSALGPAALTSFDTGAYIGVAPKTLSNWRALGVGPAYISLGPTGSKIVYSLVALDAFVAAHTISGAR